NT
ncbi:hypothetical protein G4B88_030966, partial [Cannabis sativa]